MESIENSLLRKNGLLLFVTLYIQIISLRVIDKYVIHNSLLTLFILSITVFIIFIAVLNLAKFAYLNKMILTKKTLYIVLSLALLFSFIMYPIADGLKIVGRGSTQDDALIDAAIGLFYYGDPYAEETYNGPISAGPGWVILISPFSLTGAYFLFIPFSLFFFHYLCTQLTSNYENIAKLMLILFSSIGIWEYIAVGGDLLSLGVAILFLVVFLEKSTKLYLFIIYSIFFSMVMTARVILPILIPLFSFFIFKKDGLKKSLLFFLITGIVTTGIHYYFYVTSDYYQPFHLVNKGIAMLESLNLYVLLSVTAPVTMFWFRRLQKTLKYNIESLVFSVALILTQIVSLISLLDLRDRNFAFAYWEGSNYLILTIPLWIAYYLLHSSSRIMGRGNQ